MNKTVYIAVCYIPAMDTATTKVKIFSTLDEAQAFKAQQESRPYTVFCDIYESHKIMS